jgi:hypothetical protein
MERRCDTCAKRHSAKRKGCKVLKAQIGLKQGCWAWDDDPLWQEEAKAAGRAYAERRGLGR